MILTKFRPDFEFKLLLKLRSSNKSQIEPHNRKYYYDKRLLENIEDCSIIYVNYHLCPKIFYQIPDFFDNSDKTYNLIFHWSIFSLNSIKKARKKEDKLNRALVSQFLLRRLLPVVIENTTIFKPHILKDV